MQKVAVTAVEIEDIAVEACSRHQSGSKDVLTLCKSERKRRRSGCAPVASEGKCFDESCYSEYEKRSERNGGQKSDSLLNLPFSLSLCVYILNVCVCCAGAGTRETQRKTR